MLYGIYTLQCVIVRFSKPQRKVYFTLTLDSYHMRLNDKSALSLVVSLVRYRKSVFSFLSHTTFFDTLSHQLKRTVHLQFKIEINHDITAWVSWGGLNFLETKWCPACGLLYIYFILPVYISQQPYWWISYFGSYSMNTQQIVIQRYLDIVP